MHAGWSEYSHGYSHGTDLAPDALGSSGRAITFAACRAHVAVVCVFVCLCVFACAGNGARLALELADGAGGRSRRPAPAGASAPSSSCDAPPLPGGPPQRRGAADTPRWAAPSSCRFSAVMWRSKCDHPRVPPRLSYSAAVRDRSTSARCPCIARLEGRARARHLRLAAAVRARMRTVAIVSAARVAFSLERAACSGHHPTCTLAGRGRSDARRAVPLCARQ